MKKILIFANALDSGGVEISLINLLKELSKIKDYNITLMLLSNEGAYKENIPKNIIIKTLKFSNKYYDLFNREKYKLNKFILLFYKIYFKLLRVITKGKQNEYLVKKTIENKEEYDLVIDFHGYGYIGTQYVAYKIKSKKKILFIHDEKMDWLSRVDKTFDRFDYFFCVSNSCAKILKEKCPKINPKKICVFHNIIDKDKIITRSKEDCYIKLNKESFNIATVGRIEWEKGSDIIVKTADLLKKKNINFKWYVIGKGKMFENVKKMISKKKLEDNVIMLGFQINPYNILKQANLYVQTSRHEGYCIAVAEAKILCIPIVATNIECIKEQLTDGINASIAECNASDISDKILNLYNDKKLLEKYKNALENENTTGYLNDIKLITNLLEKTGELE